ncbi:hypothetical protein AB9K21_02560 [Anaplasma phagocytophilum]|uniref:p44-7 outer membrane domain protein n=1 Tax=Anaplasma phagocytophilum str. ApNP TaxID=1359153 RepID=A0A0F3NFF7_ANAPH|nr:hypothetical protein [Anaplasma phagocytophilum]KJV66501.1 P44-7 outer membrane domain protein [Anaplasma phagocytophilum str. ApNP]
MKLGKSLGVVPYACVGLAGNFVGVIDGTCCTIRLRHCMPLAK